MANNPFSILIAGDLVINRPYEVKNIDPSIIDLFKQSNLNIINLEAPVVSGANKIIKTGPHLSAHENSTINVLAALNINVVTLANNHLLDYGEKGVKDTLLFCQKNTIKSVGAGMNLKESSKNLFVSTNQGKIAIVNFAENEWASASDNSAGANPMDIIENAKQIQDARSQADFVFVIIHGGLEYYHLPSPRMIKQYRFYAEQGADIVVGHHTHCISGNEVFKGVPIFYSLGNFLFTKPSSYEDWYWGSVLKINVKEGKLFPEIHPIKQQKENFGIELLRFEEKTKILNQIRLYNSIIANDSRLKEEWNNLLVSKSSFYLNYWSPINFIKNRYVRALFRKFGINGLNKRGAALYLNLLRCETHSDLSKQILNNYIRNNI